MYDFYFGDKDQIISNPEAFLISVKRMLPRWINGIPDSECVAIFHTLSSIESDEPVILETGCGASTLSLFLYAALNGGKVFSWDTNGSKGSFLRTVISEAVCRPLELDLYKYWTFIGFDSTSQHVGIPVIKELGYKADFCYFDSWHTLNHLLNEVECFEKVTKDNFYLALDDAYYTKRYNNFAYLNMIRRKLGLSSVAEPADNVCDPFYEEIERYLKSRYKCVEKIQDTYKQSYKEDLFFSYFDGDRNAMNALGMEVKESLEHRFDVWRVGRSEGLVS